MRGKLLEISLIAAVVLVCLEVAAAASTLKKKMKSFKCRRYLSTLVPQFCFEKRSPCTQIIHKCAHACTHTCKLRTHMHTHARTHTNYLHMRTPMHTPTYIPYSHTHAHIQTKMEMVTFLGKKSSLKHLTANTCLVFQVGLCY